MVIDLARGKRVSVFPLASPAQVVAVLKTLR
jgi:transposase